MKILNVNIANKIATYIQRGGKIVCGNDGYKIQFTFDAEWDAYEEKTARFKWNGAYCDVQFTGDTVPVPCVSNTTELEVGVYAGETLCTSTSTTIECLLSCLCGTATQNPYEEGFRAGVASKQAELDEIDALLDEILEAQESLIPKTFTVKHTTTEEITTFEFKKGMTWAEWCDSEYNTVGYSYYDTVVYGGNLSAYIYEDYGDGIMARPTDIIMADHEYYLNQW